jgi:hypothetical protein
MKLIDFIEEDTVLGDLKSTDKESVIREMVEVLCKLKKIDESDINDVMDALLRREKVGEYRNRERCCRSAYEA